MRLRLKRMGKKHHGTYRICAFDARSPRDGRELEILGTYDPFKEKDEDKVVVDRERVIHWLDNGARPTDKVAVLLKKHGINP